MNQEKITYDSKGFIINSKRKFLIGGEFHYFRVPADLWEDRLQKMKRMGANLISVYIPWNIHEPEEGKERWTGDYDLERFLTLCEKSGFHILIKPGPYVCAELDFGGHPDWLIAKAARNEIKLRTLDEGYLNLCKRWYKRVSEFINPHLITNGGRIIAIQIENEYDHLIEYGEETITQQDAIDYFLFLKKTMEEYDINIPKFANEAAFLRGRDIIDTRTYYPNIPGLWMWEFDLFESKIIEAKKEQPDCPVMILELQAGWFAQIGAPIYEPELDVVECVSKSVLIQGASIMNYYMMVGGTTFPFTGARGDVFFLGGLGNITSYDFGGAPIREWGELHHEKYYWIKGFIRFSKEFGGIILNHDEKEYVRLISGGENIAILGKNATALDATLDKSFENFATYERGNQEGRFFFIRNLEEEDKRVSVNISNELMGKEYTFNTIVKAKETRLLPIAFKIPGSDVVIQYSTSEVLLSKKYEDRTAFILFGKSGTNGEMSINVDAEEISVIKGDINMEGRGVGTLLYYVHSDISIMKINNIYLFIIEENMVGRVEELELGLFIHNMYYIEEIRQEADTLELDVQLKEKSSNEIMIFPMIENADFKQAVFNEKSVGFKVDDESGMFISSIDVQKFPDGPDLKWTSQWKYMEDSREIIGDDDSSVWVNLDRPVSLEEAGFFEHGYYWYKTEFELDDEPKVIFMDYRHNDTDRMFIYNNGELIYKSHNRKIKKMDITRALRRGYNRMAILYANEFHNKSHPHEGAIIKYSGILNPIELYGAYKDGREMKLSLEAFQVKKGLTGINTGYHTSEYNDVCWKSIPDVDKFVVAPELGHIVWFRRKFRYDKGEGFHTSLFFRTREADQRLTIYVNGRPVAIYDILGPQDEFYIPETYLNFEGENVISIILECPAFYDELQSGYRRGYIYNPSIYQKYISKSIGLKIL